jgi:GNAT superfamily N-acetyltransferase
MRIELADNPLSALAEYASVPSAFTVDHVLDVAGRTDGSSGFVLSERRLIVPYVKDYDAIEGQGPQHWMRRFDVSNLALFTAREEDRVVGAAAVALNTPSLLILGGRFDVAALWDIRVWPDSRRKGVGSALFVAVVTWATSQGCRDLKVETQNINVPACRFYTRHGCELQAVHHSVYLDLPEEIQLIWCKDLRDDGQLRRGSDDANRERSDETDLGSKPMAKER